MTLKQSQIELHAHPYFEKYRLRQIVEAMDRNLLNIICLIRFNGTIFDEVRGLSRTLVDRGYTVDSDSLALRIEKDGKERYVLRTKESETSEGFHLITIGSDNIQSYQPMRKMIDQTIEQGAIPIFDHPFVDNSNVRREISGENEIELWKICRDYAGHLALEWNGYCIPWARKLLGGRDVNQDTLRLSRFLSAEGYNVPVVADSDTHVRSKYALKKIGTARVIMNVNLTSGRTIIDSMKARLFSGEEDAYQNIYRTVSFPHFVLYFGIPYVFSKLLNRPRG